MRVGEPGASRCRSCGRSTDSEGDAIDRARANPWSPLYGLTREQAERVYDLLNAVEAEASLGS